MPIPSTPDIAQATLRFLADGQIHRRRDILNALATDFDLTSAEREEKTPSGRNRFGNLFSSAIHRLQKGKLIEQPRHTYWRITELGKVSIEEQSLFETATQTASDSSTAQGFNSEQLREGSESDTATSISAIAVSDNPVEDNLSLTTEESIEADYQQIQGELAADLLQRIKDNSPDFFEKLVIDLLVAMGYGGSREEAGKAVGGSGDGGIDGVINEDILGLDVIYVQAKRWQGNVGEPPVRDFVGALQGRRARKGIFITTSAFSNGAKGYVAAIDSRDTKIILIDGHQLAQFMIQHNVGVSTVKSYEIKRVDSDYFAEEDE